MHTIHINQRGVDAMKPRLPHLEVGRYLVTDDNLGELFVLKRAEQAHYINLFDPPHSPITPDDDIIYLIPAGGHGDQLFLTPSLLEIHRQFPVARIRVCVFEEYFPCLESPGLEFVERVAYPPKADDVINEYDDVSVFVNRCTVSLENCIQPGKDAVTAMAERVGVTLTNKQPYYRVSAPELATAQARFPRTERKRIGVQLKATAKCRSWTPRHVQQFVNACSLNGWEVFLFGAPGEAQGQMPPHVVNLTAEDPPLSFREAAAIVPSLDVMVAPDSAFCHLAGALNVPTLALYGPFLASERVSHSPSIRPLQGHGGCPLAPCNFHQIAGQEWPDNGPCASTGVCSEMDALKPSYLIQQVKKILRI